MSSQHYFEEVLKIDNKKKIFKVTPVLKKEKRGWTRDAPLRRWCGEKTRPNDISKSKKIRARRRTQMGSIGVKSVIKMQN